MKNNTMKTKGGAGPDDEKLGSLIRVARNQAGMSQKSLAEKLGVTFQQLQKYERGRNRVSAVCLLKIARIFEMPVTFFYDGITLPAIDALSDPAR